MPKKHDNKPWNLRIYHDKGTLHDNSSDTICHNLIIYPSQIPIKKAILENISVKKLTRKTHLRKIKNKIEKKLIKKEKKYN
jgi:hypothetical protein